MAVRFADKLAKIVGDGNRAELAKRAGLSPTYISNIINSGTTPRADKAAKIAAALNVSLDWMANEATSLPTIERSDVLDFDRLLDSKTRKAFEELAAAHGRGVCLAAAVQAFIAASEQDRAVPLMRAATAARRGDMTEAMKKK